MKRSSLFCPCFKKARMKEASEAAVVTYTIGWLRGWFVECKSDLSSTTKRDQIQSIDSYELEVGVLK
jgi:hypothetical protein